jgi:hypothetical protein
MVLSYPDPVFENAQEAVLFSDGSCTPNPYDFATVSVCKLGLGITLGGSVYRVEKAGDPTRAGWWKK